MNQIKTKGIILTRVDYGEADRILTLLTPDMGKLRLMARGVRKPKSRLAGGIELFCISEISFIKGRGEIGTLTSSRLDNYYGDIVKELSRVQLGYELIKMINKTTEDEPESEYFSLLIATFEALNNKKVDENLIRSWFIAQLLKLAGHSPNLRLDTNGEKLLPEKTYNFDLEAVALTPHTSGKLNINQIKTCRLLFSDNNPNILSRIQGIESIVPSLQIYLNSIAGTYLRI